MSDPSTGPDVLVVLPSSHRTAAGTCAAAFLRWARRELAHPPRGYALAGGDLKRDLRALGVKVVESPRYPLRTVEKTLIRLDREREARTVRKAQHTYLFAKPPHPDVILAVGCTAAARAARHKPSRTRLVTYCFEDGPTLDTVLDEATRAHLVRVTDGWVAAHRGVADDLLARGVRRDAVVTIAPFVDDPAPSRGRSVELRRSLGLADGEVLVGGIGPSDWTAGPDLFLRAAAVAAARHPDLPVRFVWVGAPDDGPTRWILEHDVRHAGLADRVTLTGELRDAGAWAGAVDLLLVTDRVDALPSSVLQGGAMGVPVLGFRGGALQQLADDVGGWPAVSLAPPLDVVALVDALALLIDDEERRQEAADQMRSTLPACGLADTVAPRLWDVLVRVADGDDVVDRVS
jgi:glycosyltransferase involved in cell wall biosynthesis